MYNLDVIFLQQEFQIHAQEKKNEFFQLTYDELKFDTKTKTMPFAWHIVPNFLALQAYGVC